MRKHGIISDVVLVVITMAFVFLVACESKSKKNAIETMSPSPKTTLHDGYKQTPSLYRTVWICNSPKADVYHLDGDCEGLNSCRHGIIEVSEEEARDSYGRRLCRICAQ